MTSVADLIVARLCDAGVRCLFGVPGGGCNLDLIDAAGRAGLPFVLTSTETSGAIAALAQAEISGHPGACLTTLGPGVASVVNGVACAYLERAPLLIFTDTHPATSGGIFEHQRLDHRALLAPVTKWSAVLTPDKADEVMRQAITRAIEEPRGPVHIEVSGDIGTLASHPTTLGASRRWDSQALAQIRQTPPSGGVVREPTSDEHHAAHGPGMTTGDQGLAIDDWELVRVARRPILLVGLGARRTADVAAIRALYRRRGMPALVTYKAKGVVPDDDPHFAGVFTNGVIEQPTLEEADLLIGVGLDPVELIPRAWRLQTPIINIARSRMDDLHLPFAAQLVTDIPAGLQRVGDLLTGGEWDLGAIGHRLAVDRARMCPRASDRLAPHRVVQVAAAAAAGSRVTVDAGAHMFSATMLWPASDPNGMLISNGLSTMGFALPAAIGAALIDPSQPIVALTGDGGLLMCAGELLTAVRQRLKVIVIVFNDSALSLIDIKQRQRHLASAGVSLGDVSWCGLAESLGVTAHVVRTESELGRAVGAALHHDGPSLIDAIVDPGTYGDALRIVRG